MAFPALNCYAVNGYAGSLYPTIYKNSINFREKAVLLYGRLQNYIGIPAQLFETDIIAGIDVNFTDTISNTVFEYVGAFNTRSSNVAINNTLRKVEFSCLFPSVDSTEILTETSIGLTDWFRVCGASVSLQNNTLQFSNELPDCSSRLTAEVQRIPENDPENQNTYPLYDVIGTVSLDLTVGQLAKFTFSCLGKAGLPYYTNRLGKNFQKQKVNVLKTINRTTILSALLTNLTTNRTYSFCFFRIQIENLFGFVLTELQLSDAESVEKFSKISAVAVTVPVNEENSATAQTPEYSLGERYNLVLQLGTVNFPVILELTELQLADYKKAPIGELAGLSLGFINSGFTRLTFTGPATP